MFNFRHYINLIESHNKIEVNGVNRPIHNNEGNLIHNTTNGILNFWKWFGNSKVVDENGRPLVVYHSGLFDETYDDVPRFGKEGFHFGTKSAAEERISGKRVDDFIKHLSIDQYENNDGELKWYWASDGVDSYDLTDGFDTKEEARDHAERIAVEQEDYYEEDDSDIIPLTVSYLRIINPVDLPDQKNDWSDAVHKIVGKGHDGIRYINQYESKGSISWIVLHPNQIKSINNDGTFSSRENTRTE